MKWGEWASKSMREGERRRVSFLLPMLLLYALFLLGAPLFLLVLIGAWYVALVTLESMGSLDRMDATRVLGIILMLRTGRGKKVLDRISRNRRFWRVYGELSIWLCFLVMIGVILLLFVSAIETALHPPDEYIPTGDLLLIPGVTSFVPFWWPAIALIVALIIHEYSHGIQARAHGMRLRSFGLLLVGPVPIGAFAEPEEMEMTRAPRRDRMRLFAAGPSINIFATYVTLILLSAVSSGLVAEHDGVHARGIVEGGAAEGAGLMPYETITHIDGIGFSDYEGFSERMDSLSAGDVAAFTVLSSPAEEGARESRDLDITLGDRYEHVSALCEGDDECIEQSGGAEPGDAFLGIYDVRPGTAGVDGYSYIVSGDYSFGVTAIVALIEPLIMLQTPIALNGQTMVLEERAMLVVGDGLVASALGTDGMLMLFDFLFWLVWINFLLGFANLIPMVPFDGGHLVRDGVHSVLNGEISLGRYGRLRLGGGMHPMRIEAIANRISNMSSFFILLVLVIPIIIPRIL